MKTWKKHPQSKIEELASTAQNGPICPETKSYKINSRLCRFSVKYLLFNCVGWSFDKNKKNLALKWQNAIYFHFFGQYNLIWHKNFVRKRSLRNSRRSVMPCPSKGPKMILAGPIFFCRTKNFIYILFQAQTFCASRKIILGWLKKIGPAQNILGHVKGQGINAIQFLVLHIKIRTSTKYFGTCRRTRHKNFS